MLEPSQAPPAAVLAALPVFPLPNVVLLPGMTLPLNVFEPRYLELVDHVRGHGGLIGVPLLMDATTAPPRMAEVFGVGRLAHHQRLPDGRRLIRLEGLGRVRTIRELPAAHGFRRLEVEPLAEPGPRDRAAFDLLRAEVRRLVGCGEVAEREVTASILAITDARIVSYALVALLPLLAATRSDGTDEGSDALDRVTFQQRCLDCECPDERVQLLADLVAELQLRRPGGGAGSLLH